MYIYISHARKRLNYFSVYQKLTQNCKSTIKQKEKLSRENRVWNDLGEEVEVDPVQEESSLVLSVCLAAVYGTPTRGWGEVLGSGYIGCKLCFLPLCSSGFVEGDTHQVKNPPIILSSIFIIIGDRWKGNAGPRDNLVHWESDFISGVREFPAQVGT